MTVRRGQDKFPDCKAEETKGKTAIIFAVVKKSGDKFNAYYQLNDVVQSTTWSHSRSKIYKFFTILVWSYCFSGVFWCMYSLRNTVVNADARSYE